MSTDEVMARGSAPDMNPDDPVELGAEFNPFDPNFLADPHAFFARARGEAPVCRNTFMNTWLVTRHDDVLRVLDDDELFSSQDRVGPMANWPPEVVAVLRDEGYLPAAQLFSTDPPEHTRIRTQFTKGFTPQRIATLEPSIRAAATELIDAMMIESGAGAADLRAGYTHPLPRTVILDMIGVPRADHPRLEVWFQAWGALYDPMASPEALLAAVRQVVDYQHYYTALIAERRAHPSDDLVSALVTGPDEEFASAPLAEDELIWQLMGLQAAGHETTTNVLTSILALLLRDRAQWRRAATEPAYVDNVVEEGLRVVNPVLGLPRRTTRQCELGNVCLDAGAELLVSFASANRDLPDMPDPDVFNPDRPGVARHVGFGWGTHFCIGSRLARLQLRVAIRVLAERLPGLHLPANATLEYSPHPFLWGPSRLLVEWDEVEFDQGERSSSGPGLAAAPM